MNFGSFLRCDIYEESIAVVTIDNPPVNTLSRPVLEGLELCFHTLGEDKSLRCIVLTGTGKSFLAGADIKEFAGMESSEISRSGQEKLAVIEACPLPVIAAINGYCFGGGLEAALACDFRIADETATFAFPEVSLGIAPTYGGLTRAPWLIGQQHARYLIYTADRISARQAEAFGLLLQVSRPGELPADALALAKKIATNAPISIRCAKQTILRARDIPFAESFDNEVRCNQTFDECSDTQEGLSAFAQKRKPIFQNR